MRYISRRENLGRMDFLVGIHIKDYNGTSNSQGKNDFKMTGIKVLTLPEMGFYDIMFEDYIGYSNGELYSLLVIYKRQEDLALLMVYTLMVDAI